MWEYRGIAHGIPTCCAQFFWFQNHQLGVYDRMTPSNLRTSAAGSIHDNALELPLRPAASAVDCQRARKAGNSWNISDIVEMARGRTANMWRYFLGHIELTQMKVRQVRNGDIT